MARICVLASRAARSVALPEMNVVDLPFLFRDGDHAYKILQNLIQPAANSSAGAPTPTIRSSVPLRIQAP